MFRDLRITKKKKKIAAQKKNGQSVSIAKTLLTRPIPLFGGSMNYNYGQNTAQSAEVQIRYVSNFWRKILRRFGQTSADISARVHIALTADCPHEQCQKKRLTGRLSISAGLFCCGLHFAFPFGHSASHFATTAALPSSRTQTRSAVHGKVRNKT